MCRNRRARYRGCTQHDFSFSYLSTLDDTLSATCPSLSANTNAGLTSIFTTQSSVCDSTDRATADLSSFSGSNTLTRADDREPSSLSFRLATWTFCCSYHSPSRTSRTSDSPSLSRVGPFEVIVCDKAGDSPVVTGRTSGNISCRGRSHLNFLLAVAILLLTARHLSSTASPTTIRHVVGRTAGSLR